MSMKKIKLFEEFFVNESKSIEQLKKIYTEFFTKNVGKEAVFITREGLPGAKRTETGKIESNKDGSMYKIEDMWYELEWDLENLPKWKIITFEPKHLVWEFGGTYYNLTIK